MKRPLKIPREALPYIEYLEAELLKFKKSPYVKSYLTIYNQLEDFNNQLTLRSGTDSYGKEIMLGRVDLFGDKDDKSFDRTKWYFDKILDLNESLDKIRKLMTPEEQKELGKAKPLLEESAENFLKKD